jgi:hypothetical protein
MKKTTLRTYEQTRKNKAKKQNKQRRNVRRTKNGWYTS